MPVQEWGDLEVKLSVPFGWFDLVHLIVEPSCRWRGWKSSARRRHLRWLVIDDGRLSHGETNHLYGARKYIPPSLLDSDLLRTAYSAGDDRSDPDEMEEREAPYIKPLCSQLEVSAQM